MDRELASSLSYMICQNEYRSCRTDGQISERNYKRHGKIAASVFQKYNWDVLCIKANVFMGHSNGHSKIVCDLKVTLYYFLSSS